MEETYLGDGLYVALEHGDMRLRADCDRPN